MAQQQHARPRQHRKDHQRDQKLNQSKAVPSHSAARIKLSMADDAPSRPATVISTCNNRASSVARTSRVQRHVRPPFSISLTSLPIEGGRSEEHTSELQSLMRLSYDVFCLQKKTH